MDRNLNFDRWQFIRDCKMKAFLRRLSARNGEHCGSESPEHWLQRMRLDSSRWFSTSLKSEANEVTHLVLLAVFSSGTSPWTIVGATIVAAGIRAIPPAQIALRVGSAAPLLHEAGRFCIATALWLALAVLFGLGAHRCVCFLALSLSLFFFLSLSHPPLLRFAATAVAAASLSHPL